MIYSFLFKRVLAHGPAESMHVLTARILGALTLVPGIRAALRLAFQPRAAALRVRTLGRTFSSPLGAAAGMDKGATWFEALGALGFGFVEVGTVTARPQAGNSGDRVWRLIEHRAILNRLGFPNPGAEKVARRLRRRADDPIVGVNIGKSATASLEGAPADYGLTVRELAPHADFMVLNVSSPNTPGLRSMQTAEMLRPLVREVREGMRAVSSNTPLLLKIGPDLSDETIDAIADVALDLGLDGIVATNTTTEHEHLLAGSDPAGRQGGVSGPPLKARAVHVLGRLHERAGGRLVLVSVGGIETADDVWQRIVAGATLVQAYTGFVYGGPLWPSRINRELLRKLRAEGFSSLEKAAGSASGSSRKAAAGILGGL